MIGDFNSAQVFDWRTQLSDYKCPNTCKFPVDDFAVGGGGGGVINQSGLR